MKYVKDKINMLILDGVEFPYNIKFHDISFFIRYKIPNYHSAKINLVSYLRNLKRAMFNRQTRWLVRRLKERKLAQLFDTLFRLMAYFIFLKKKHPGPAF